MDGNALMYHVVEQYNILIGVCLMLSGAGLLWHHIILRPDARQWPVIGKFMRGVLFAEGVVALTIGLKVVQAHDYHSPSFVIVSIAVLVHVATSLVNEYVQRRQVRIRRKAVAELMKQGAHVFCEDVRARHV